MIVPPGKTVPGVVRGYALVTGALWQLNNPKSLRRWDTARENVARGKTSIISGINPRRPSAGYMVVFSISLIASSM